MLELVKGCHERTGLNETVLVISISVCLNKYLIYRNSVGTTRKCLVYSICIKWTQLYGTNAAL